ncbi:hypothetical protein F1559_004803 [Cyanidiococcus yangmingshanensis]|uniref:Uncharacterized protein n=1 Tax=Cyanidiococcus yangmingshanensis TaxID=2690220 RepID=A0A7J7ILW0_9RHOD|nr:hypothetical protein F1559_004803 [Cyanidiococcus yangmingshanensis]
MPFSFFLVSAWSLFLSWGTGCFGWTVGVVARSAFPYGLRLFFLVWLVAVSASPPRWNWFERSFVLVQWFAWLRLFVFLLQLGTFQQEWGFVLATFMYFRSGLLDSGSR